MRSESLEPISHLPTCVWHHKITTASAPVPHRNSSLRGQKAARQCLSHCYKPNSTQEEKFPSWIHPSLQPTPHVLGFPLCWYHPQHVLRQSRTGFRMQNLLLMGRAFILGPVDGFSTWLMTMGALQHRDLIAPQEETPCLPRAPPEHSWELEAIWECWRGTSSLCSPSARG